jgi:hypothetical protein
MAIQYFSVLGGKPVGRGAPHPGFELKGSGGPWPKRFGADFRANARVIALNTFCHQYAEQGCMAASGGGDEKARFYRGYRRRCGGLAFRPPRPKGGSA